MACLELQGVGIEIGDNRVCHDLSIRIQEHERWALLGKNGAGKTTLLHTLIGLHHASTGDISINGTPISIMSRRDHARYVGMLFQEGLHSMPATVLETVLLGRHPHVQSLLTDTPQDLEIARQALRSLDLEALEERQIDSLSGGEKQRLALAMLIAQTPKLFLLDEPSNHLDLAFQVKLLTILEQRLTTYSACLLMATHDINLAARFCDKFVLLSGNGETCIGSRDEVLTEENLSAAYECPMRVIAVDGMRLYYPAL